MVDKFYLKYRYSHSDKKSILIPDYQYVLNLRLSRNQPDYIDGFSYITFTYIVENVIYLRCVFVG